jgi:hypothetical protein
LAKSQKNLQMAIDLNGVNMRCAKNNRITRHVVTVFSSFRSNFKINIILISVYIVNSCGAVSAENRVDTVAGELSYVKNKTVMECITSLNKKPILQFDCEFAFEPKIIGDFRDRLGTLDEVIVLQERLMGSACNGGPLHVIGLRKDKSYLVSCPLDFCGGKNPIIEHNEGSISITFPSSPSNRGFGIIPMEQWLYKDGQLRRIK